MLYALHADAWLTGGTESDRFHIQYQEGEVNTTVITDFSSADRLFIKYQDREDGLRFDYYGDGLFQMLDTNGDRLLDGSDGFSVTTEGVGLGVGREAPTCPLLGEDSIRLENVDHIASTDWV